MARSTSCASCGARVPRGAFFCPSCGQSLGLEIETEGFDTDDELDRQPITVELDRPHGLRNLVIAAGAVGLFVVGAVVVGRHDAKQPAASVDSTTTTSSPRSRTTVAAASTSTTSTSSTIPPPSTSAWIDLVPKGPLLPEPTGTVLYSTTPDGRIVRIDLDTGAVTIRSTDSGDGVGAQFFLRGGKLVVFRPDTGSAFVVSADLRTQTQELRVENGSLVLRGPGDDELWVLGPGEDQGVSGLRYAQRIRTDGTPVGPRITLPGGVGDDGAGQLIYYVVNAAKTYALDPTTGVPTRVLDGLPLAIDHDRAVDLSCDDHLACRLRVTDRATGRQRVVPGPASSRLLDYGTGNLSPDGRWLAMLQGPGQMIVVDLRDGSERQFDDARLTAYWGQGPAWSPDGQWLFWTGGPRVYAWRAGSATAQTIGGDGLPELLGLVAASKTP